MIWSISSYKQFQRCPRQWYYKNKVADERAKKDAFRREITILSKLQSIQAWRGQIVDDVISRLLVNAINNRRPLNKDYFLQEAFAAFENGFEYAAFQKYRQGGGSYSDKYFAALVPLEFGEPIDHHDLIKAKEDIHLAISNLLDNTELISYLRSAQKIVSQRLLTYYHNQFTVQAKPDLIAFFVNKPPHLFDWKVHSYGLYTYDEQLVSYAVALHKVMQSKPHSDFPKGLDKYALGDYKLTEYQLLHKDRLERNYTLTQERLDAFGANLSSSLMAMFRAGATKSLADLTEERFGTTTYVESCRSCGFKKICK